MQNPVNLYGGHFTVGYKEHIVPHLLMEYECKNPNEVAEKAIGAICCEFMMINSGYESANIKYALELLIHFLGHFPNREGYQKLKSELEELLEWQKKKAPALRKCGRSWMNSPRH